MAKDYDRRWKSFVLPVRSWLLSRLEYKEKTSFNLLDMGCGTGGALFTVAEAYPNAFLNGIDISPEMLNIAQTRLSNISDVTLINDNLETIDIQDSKYDVVINFFVLHHILDQERFLKNLIKGTKTGGDIFIADYAIDTIPMLMGEIFWRLFLPSHYKAYSSKQLKKMLENHSDIDIVEFIKISPNWFWRQSAFHLKKR